MKYHEKLRQLKGEMSESELAERSGVPYPSIHSYCLGRRTPTFAAVVKIAAALGVDCREFAECVAEEAEPPKRGRPLKDKPAPPPKRPRGRPKKEK